MSMYSKTHIHITYLVVGMGGVAREGLQGAYCGTYSTPTMPLWHVGVSLYVGVMMG
jgi:hypothetical protein